MKTYSFFIDDNIFFLKDIAASDPASIFDHFFPAKLRELHEKYQVKFLLNLFKGDQNSGFTLNEFPDRYKNELEENQNWLRFSFHAAFDKTHYFDTPGCITSTAAEFKRDYFYVKNEVIRFAGAGRIRNTPSISLFDNKTFLNFLSRISTQKLFDFIRQVYI